MLELPPIDMTLPETQIINLLMEQLTNIGFLHIKNVKGLDEDILLPVCNFFHSIPDTEKEKLMWKTIITITIIKIYFVD